MKLALLGDIHGNHLALQSVLAAASSLGAEKLLVTGDLVGYYFSPLKVLESLRSWDKHLVRGNHEVMLATARSNPRFLLTVDERYGTGLRVVFEQLDAKQIDDLCSLPHPLELVIDDCAILLCHGAPWDIDQYVYPDANSDLMGRFSAQEFDLVVLGHTHHPMKYETGRAMVVNPGSVGQPRNRLAGAHWALFDTLSRGVQFFQEEYDDTEVVRECWQRCPELPYLSEVLSRR